MSQYVINAGLKFNVSSASVQPVISSLQKQLTANPINIPVDLKINQAALKNISKADASFQSLNATLVKLSQSAGTFNSQVNQLSASLAGLHKNIAGANSSANTFSRLGSAANTATRSVQGTGIALQKTSRNAVTFGEAIGVAARRLGAFAPAAFLLYGLVAQFHEATKAALDFDQELVRLKQVGGDTPQVIASIAASVTRLSTTLGTNSGDLIKSAVTLRQAGLSARETKQALEALAKTTLSPTFDSLSNTTEGVIAILAQFKQGTAALEKQLGSISKVSADYAVESSDLVEAIRRMGGAFISAGGNLNELLATFTSVRATTRESAESISTGLRTIIARMQSPEVTDKLKEYGIQLYDTKNQFVGLYKAVDILATKLKELPSSDKRFAEIANILGGNRNLSRVIPLIQQQPLAKRALQSAEKGAGVLDKDAELAQAALIIQLNKLKESFLELFRIVSNDSSIRLFFAGITTSVNALAGALKTITPLIPIFTAIAGYKAVKGLGGFGHSVTRGFTQVRGFSKGGVVTGGTPGRDSVPAMLEPGELVVPRNKVQKFAKGGLIPREYSSLRDRFAEMFRDPKGKEIYKHLKGSTYLNRGNVGVVFRHPEGHVLRFGPNMGRSTNKYMLQANKTTEYGRYQIEELPYAPSIQETVQDKWTPERLKAIRSEGKVPIHRQQRIVDAFTKRLEKEGIPSWNITAPNIARYNKRIVATDPETIVTMSSGGIIPTRLGLAKQSKSGKFYQLEDLTVSGGRHQPLGSIGQRTRLRRVEIDPLTGEFTAKSKFYAKHRQGRFLKKFSDGGLVDGLPTDIRSGTDSIPTLLTPGEFVLSTTDVKNMGGTAQINRMRKLARGVDQFSRLESKYGYDTAYDVSKRQSAYDSESGYSGDRFAVGGQKQYAGYARGLHKSSIKRSLYESLLAQNGIRDPEVVPHYALRDVLKKQRSSITPAFYNKVYNNTATATLQRATTGNTLVKTLTKMFLKRQTGGSIYDFSQGNPSQSTFGQGLGDRHIEEYKLAKKRKLEEEKKVREARGGYRVNKIPVTGNVPIGGTVIPPANRNRGYNLAKPISTPTTLPPTPNFSYPVENRTTDPGIYYQNPKPLPPTPTVDTGYERSQQNKAALYHEYHPEVVGASANELISRTNSRQAKASLPSKGDYSKLQLQGRSAEALRSNRSRVAPFTFDKEPPRARNFRDTGLPHNLGDVSTTPASHVAKFSDFFKNDKVGQRQARANNVSNIPSMEEIRAVNFNQLQSQPSQVKQKPVSNIGIEHGSNAVGNVYPLANESSRYRLAPEGEALKKRLSAQTPKNVGVTHHQFIGQGYETANEAESLKQRISAQKSTKIPVSNETYSIKGEPEVAQAQSRLSKSFPTFKKYFESLGTGISQLDKVITKSTGGVPSTAGLGTRVKGFAGKIGGKLNTNTGRAIGATAFAVGVPAIADHLLGNAEKPGSLGTSGAKAGSVLSGAISGGTTGAIIGGSVGGPVGAGVGAFAGALLGAVTSLKTFDEELGSINLKNLGEALGSIDLSKGKPSITDQTKISGILSNSINKAFEGSSKLREVNDKTVIEKRSLFSPVGLLGNARNIDQSHNPTKNERLEALPEDQKKELSAYASRAFEKISTKNPNKSYAEINKEHGDIKTQHGNFSISELLHLDKVNIDPVVKFINEQKEAANLQEKLNAIMKRSAQAFELTASQLEIFSKALSTAGESYGKKSAYTDIGSNALQGRVSTGPNDITVGNLGGVGKEISDFSKQGGGYDKAKQDLIKIIQEVGSNTSIKTEEARGAEAERRFSEKNPNGPYNQNIAANLNSVISHQPELSTAIKQGKTKNIAEQALSGVQGVRDTYDQGNQQLRQASGLRQQQLVEQENRRIGIDQQRAAATSLKADRTIGNAEALSVLNPQSTTSQQFTGFQNGGIIGKTKGFIGGGQTQKAQRVLGAAIPLLEEPRGNIVNGVPLKRPRKVPVFGGNVIQKENIGVEPIIRNKLLAGAQLSKKDNRTLQRKNLLPQFQSRIVSSEETAINRTNAANISAFGQSQEAINGIKGGGTSSQITTAIKSEQGNLEKLKTGRQQAINTGSAQEVNKFDSEIAKSTGQITRLTTTLSNLANSTVAVDAAQKKYSLAVSQYQSDLQSRTNDADVLAFGSNKEKAQLQQREAITQQALTLNPQEFSQLSDSVKKTVYDRLKESEGQVRSVEQIDKYGRSRGTKDITGGQAIEQFRQPYLQQLQNTPGAGRLAGRVAGGAAAIDAAKAERIGATEANIGVQSTDVQKQAEQTTQNFQAYLKDINASIARQMVAQGAFLENSKAMIEALNGFPKELTIKREGTIEIIHNGLQLIAAVKGDLAKELAGSLEGLGARILALEEKPAR